MNKSLRNVVAETSGLFEDDMELLTDVGECVQ